MTQYSSNRLCDIEGRLNKEDHSCVKSHVVGLIPVIYEIEFDRALSMPYAVWWNDRSQPRGEVAWSGNTQKLTVEIMARTGQTVALYLGSDASPLYRKEQLYPVVVGSHNVKVIIKPKAGLDADEAVIGSPVGPLTVAEDGEKLQTYHAVLNGKTWLRFSHKYTVDEALAFADAIGGVDKGILEALRTVYQGRVSRNEGFVAELAFTKCKITFQSAADSNCRQNIYGYDSARHFGSEILTRVHPHCWISLLHAATKTLTVSMQLTSTWRPWVGSIAHRLGLGLDVKEIRNAQGHISVFDISSKQLFGSPEEKDAHENWRKKEQEFLDAKKISAKSSLANSTDTITAADEARTKARKEFDSVKGVRYGWTFENSLRTDLWVKQLYSPIDMDDNTRDFEVSKINMLSTQNENNHRDHVHITATDNFLLP